MQLGGGRKFNTHTGHTEQIKPAAFWSALIKVMHIINCMSDNTGGTIVHLES